MLPNCVISRLAVQKIGMQFPDCDNAQYNLEIARLVEHILFWKYVHYETLFTVHVTWGLTRKCGRASLLAMSVATSE